MTLRGLEEVISKFPTLSPDLAAKRAACLWEALCDVEERRGEHAFSGTYTWFYVRPHNCVFDAAFVRNLNETAWVPDRNGTLQLPGYVPFEETGWKPNPFLLSKICFTPPVIETLARKAGIELGVFDLLKKLGLTSVAELKARLDIKDERPKEEKTESPAPIRERRQEGKPDEAGEKRRGPFRGPFISYIGVRREEEEQDPDGIDKQQRMILEEKAISLILVCEPGLMRTPPNNPGFDLFEPGPDRQPIRWIEVKAMTGGLLDRPVGLSHTQFECAQKHGEAYWLYVVEHADSPEEARIARIQNPAGMARTFTFDHGWLSVADIGDATNSS